MRAGEWVVIIDIRHAARLLQISNTGSPFLWNAKPGAIDLWRIGGERTWLAPEYGNEGLFADAVDTPWSVPLAFDPGNYRLIEAKERYARFSTTADFMDRSGNLFSVSIDRQIAVTDWTREGLTVRIQSTLRNDGMGEFTHPLGLWEILQLPVSSSATCYLAATNRNAGCDCLGTGLPRIEWKNAYLVLPSLADHESKAGIAAAFTSGQAIYRDLALGHLILFRPELPPKPSLSYVDSPRRRAGRPGDALQWYTSGPMDDDPFCELELHSPSMRLSVGEECSFAVVLQCLYQ